MEPFFDIIKSRRDLGGNVLKCTENKAFNRNAPLRANQSIPLTDALLQRAIDIMSVC